MAAPPCRRRRRPLATTERTAGTVLAGTSGFAYADWAPRFYPPRTRGDHLLTHYAGRLRAVELNNTFYARPTPERIERWVAATGPAFRFVVKAQRGASWRAMRGGAAESVPWFTDALGGFGDRLGAVLFRVPDDHERDDAALGALLATWPPAIPLVVELQHPGWHVDETFARLADASAVLCATDVDGAAEPDLRRTGSFLYVRLRRSSYSEPELDAWAARLVPFVEDGLDVFVILRHDADGSNALLSETFPQRVERVRVR